MRTARAAPFPFFPPVTLRSLAQIKSRSQAASFSGSGMMLIDIGAKKVFHTLRQRLTNPI
jgi:hypothetical protein